MAVHDYNRRAIAAPRHARQHSDRATLAHPPPPVTTIETSEAQNMVAHDKHLYERDPEAWHAQLKEANASQARKRVAADVIVRDQHDRLLLVNPTYKPGWDLPGGMVEANEPPIDAAYRELQEELGLSIQIGALLCVDWIAPDGPWDDTLVFVFDGQTLPAARIDTLQVTDDELSDFCFCTRSDAAELLCPYDWQRAATALDALTTGTAKYIHRPREDPLTVSENVKLERGAE